MGLSFPKDIRNSNDVFLMYPTSFKVHRSSTDVRRKISIDQSSVIALPTPAEGISLSESGNWDEERAFQFDANASDIGAAGKMIGLKTGIEQGGPIAKIGIKGSFYNDYASQSYSGSNFRSYSFSWDLIPSSKVEAIAIVDIIKTIRKNSLPSYAKAFIEYPSMWRVYPAMNTEVGLFLKDCVITNFTVNYTPDGVLRRYISGHPVSVNMAIEFKELYRADRGDI
jgi:hypothetical protein